MNYVPLELLCACNAEMYNAKGANIMLTNIFFFFNALFNALYSCKDCRSLLFFHSLLCDGVDRPFVCSVALLTNDEEAIPE